MALALALASLASPSATESVRVGGLIAMPIKLLADGSIRAFASIRTADIDVPYAFALHAVA